MHVKKAPLSLNNPGKCVFGVDQFRSKRKQLLEKIEQNVSERFAELFFGGNWRCRQARIIARADKLIIYNL